MKELLGTETAVSITLNSLVGAAGAQSAKIDNTVNLFLEAQLQAAVKVATGGTLSTTGPNLSVYVYGSLDGTTWADGITGTAGTWTPPANINGVPILNIPTPALNVNYPSNIRSVANCFGGSLPAYWVVAVVNNTGAALDAAAGGSVSFTGLTTQ